MSDFLAPTQRRAQTSPAPAQSDELLEVNAIRARRGLRALTDSELTQRKRWRRVLDASGGEPGERAKAARGLYEQDLRPGEPRPCSEAQAKAAVAEILARLRPGGAR